MVGWPCTGTLPLLAQLCVCVGVYMCVFVSVIACKFRRRGVWVQPCVLLGEDTSTEDGLLCDEYAHTFGPFLQILNLH
jgi:hypothetical protein